MRKERGHVPQYLFTYLGRKMTAAENQSGPQVLWFSAWLGQARQSPQLSSEASLPEMHMETREGLSPEVCRAESRRGPRECDMMFSRGSKNLIHEIIRSNPGGSGGSWGAALKGVGGPGFSWSATWGAPGFVRVQSDEAWGFLGCNLRSPWVSRYNSGGS